MSAPDRVSGLEKRVEGKESRRETSRLDWKRKWSSAREARSIAKSLGASFAQGHHFAITEAIQYI